MWVDARLLCVGVTVYRIMWLWSCWKVQKQPRRRKTRIAQIDNQPPSPNQSPSRWLQENAIVPKACWQMMISIVSLLSPWVKFVHTNDKANTKPFVNSGRVVCVMPLPPGTCLFFLYVYCCGLAPCCFDCSVLQLCVIVTWMLCLSCYTL